MTYSQPPATTSDRLTLDLRDGGGARLEHRTSRIMILDDEDVNIGLIESYLEDAGYSTFITETDPTRALDVMHSEQPDVLLSDVCMPALNGLDLLQQVRADEKLRRLPVVILTAATDSGTKLRALRSGANDFLAKPVDPSELILRLQNVLDAKRHQDQLADYSDQLRHMVAVRTAEVEESRREVVECLAQAAEFRDDDTGQHIIRVGKYVRIIASELGMDDATALMMEQAAQLHDVGKIGIPDRILLKPGRFTPEEFSLMKLHAEIGRRILDPGSRGANRLAGIEAPVTNRSPLLRLAATIAESHHEKWDGSGYPRGLRGDEIPIEGRITAVADVFDALSSPRPYKDAYPIERCMEILREGSGSHFDPQVLQAFEAREQQILEVRYTYQDGITSGGLLADALCVTAEEDRR